MYKVVVTSLETGEVVKTIVSDVYPTADGSITPPFLL